MIRPKLLDTFCKAGGCTKGYQQAGFYVVGIDIDPQPNYIGDDFIQMDAIDALKILANDNCLVGQSGQRYHQYDFAAIHASPPCQAYTKSATQWRKSGVEYVDLVDTVRRMLVSTKKPYIIENVPGSPLINPTLLNGAFFGLLVARKRLFETSFPLPFVLLPPDPKPVKMGRPVKDGDVIQPVGNFSGVEYARKQMDIEWMNQSELAQAIPPAYTKWIGLHLIDFLSG